MSKQVRKAVFPAGGLGTRFLPATKVIPKEMLALVDKPIIQYGVEEAIASGIEHIIIVTGRGKGAMEDHFDHSFELDATLEKRGKRMADWGLGAVFSVKADRDVTEADLHDASLLLIGTPATNSLLAKMSDRLPLHWTPTGFKSALEGNKAAESWIREAIPSGFDVTRKPILEGRVSGNGDYEIVPAMEFLQ